MHFAFCFNRICWNCHSVYTHDISETLYLGECFWILCPFPWHARKSWKTRGGRAEDIRLQSGGGKGAACIQEIARIPALWVQVILDIFGKVWNLLVYQYCIPGTARNLLYTWWVRVLQLCAKMAYQHWPDTTRGMHSHGVYLHTILFIGSWYWPGRSKSHTGGCQGSYSAARTQHFIQRVCLSHQGWCVSGTDMYSFHTNSGTGYMIISFVKTILVL